mmetsp:Transcript_45615/g.105878  ORF Transcript_45615/g.105878 Transcript_45615/m.105878 type:complete len:261 (-) Transcript_45615:1918-2700(-)
MVKNLNSKLAKEGGTSTSAVHNSVSGARVHTNPSSAFQSPSIGEPPTTLMLQPSFAEGCLNSKVMCTGAGESQSCAVNPSSFWISNPEPGRTGAVGNVLPEEEHNEQVAQRHSPDASLGIGTSYFATLVFEKFVTTTMVRLSFAVRCHAKTQRFELSASNHLKESCSSSPACKAGSSWYNFNSEAVQLISLFLDASAAAAAQSMGFSYDHAASPISVPMKNNGRPGIPMVYARSTWSSPRRSASEVPSICSSKLFGWALS